MTRTSNFAALAMVLAAVVAVACNAGPGATGAPPTSQPTPSGSTGTPAPRPSGTPAPSAVSSAAQAAALVFASDPRWSQMVPLRSDMIGQSTWYEAFEDADGYSVNVTAGSGDCQAGCIDQHTWRYHVDPDGTVSLVGEDGEDVTVTPGTGGNGDVHVVVQLTAGPTCPVEQIPPDPSCDARAVANAEVTLFDAEGNEVATGQSDGEGFVSFDVPAGAYYVVPTPVDGLMGTPDAQAFSALDGDQVGLIFGYDTGIR